MTFLAFIAAFFLWGIWGAANSGINDTEIYIWNFHAEQWNQTDAGVCVKHGGGTGTDDGSAVGGPLNCTALDDLEIGEYVAGPIIGGIFASFVIGLLMLYGFHAVPFTMVYIIIALKVAIPVIVGIVLLAMDVGQEITAVVLFLVAAVMVCVFAFFWSTIQLVARLFKVAADGLSRNSSLVPVNALFAVLALLAKLAMLAVGLFYVGRVQVGPVNDPNAGYNTDDDGSGQATAIAPCAAELTSDGTWFLVFGLFVIGWFAFWALETRNYIVADTVGCWYWHGQSNHSGVKRAVGNAFGPHFGTLVFAGLVIWFVEQLKDLARKKTTSGNPIICVLGCCAECILGLIEYLCKMSVILTAITGTSFVTSGKEVVRLFMSSFGTMLASVGVWWIPNMILSTFVFLTSLIWSGLTGLTLYHIVLNDCNGGGDGELCLNTDASCRNVALMFGLIGGFVTFVIMLFLLSFFASILLTIVDTVYLCFVIDKDRGVITKPELHDVLEQILAQRTDIKKAQEAAAKKRGDAPPPQYTRSPPAPQQNDGYVGYDHG
jgi:hypothetical protein